MVQRNPVLDFFSHLILIIGRGRGLLPDLRHLHRLDADGGQIMASNPISLLPGSNIVESYRFALFGGKTQAGASVAPALPMMGISLASALIIAIGKIAISILSAFAIVYFRFPAKNLVFWMVFVR
jgi:sn-glycerol 3-phosphate transport system permease protein